MFRKRAFAFFIDVLIITVVLTPVVFLIDSLQAQNLSQENMQLVHGIAGLIAVIAFLSRDILGRSVGKRMCNLEIVSVKGGGRIPKWKLILRNVTVVIWPIEAIVILNSKNDTRLSDLVLGLNVVGEHNIGRRLP